MPIDFGAREARLLEMFFGDDVKNVADLVGRKARLIHIESSGNVIEHHYVTIISVTVYFNGYNESLTTDSLMFRSSGPFDLWVRATGHGKWETTQASECSLELLE